MEINTLTVEAGQQKAILSEYEPVTKELIQLLSSFSRQQLNTVPFPGSWTAAQVGEHLRKSYEGMIRMLYGPAKPTERDPGEKTEHIKKDFLDFNKKMDSPEFILPANITYDKEKLIYALQRSAAQINEAVKTLSLTETCTASLIPADSEFTRLNLQD